MRPCVIPQGYLDEGFRVCFESRLRCSCFSFLEVELCALKKELIQVLIFPDCDKWIAQCLEYDIAVQADSIAELKERFIWQLLLIFH